MHAIFISFTYIDFSMSFPAKGSLAQFSGLAVMLVLAHLAHIVWQSLVWHRFFVIMEPDGGPH